jgi:phosphoribosylanthranilate isomerase
MNGRPLGSRQPQRSIPQVKLCGLTRPDEAAGCAQAGADAIGVVFFPKSPRHVTREQARAVVEALPQQVAAVGVFVNASFDDIMRRVDRCGLSAAQLHGQEPPELAVRLNAEGVGVIKALFVNGTPGLAQAQDYVADAFLVECAKGPLPGGNAMVWDWAAAMDFGQRFPLVLAGGLSPDNVRAAIRAARPRAVDLSSGVEAAPGRKDLVKVTRLITAVRQSADEYGQDALTPVFQTRGDRRRD